MGHRAAIIIFLLLLTSVSARAQDAGKAPLTFLLSRAYQLRETSTVGGSEIRGYLAQWATNPASFQEGRFCFVVQSAQRSPHVYRVDWAPAGPDQIRLAVYVLDLEPKGPGQEGREPPRVATKLLAAQAATYEAGRELVQDAEKAAADWETHQAFLKEAFSPQPELSHEGWRKVAADLERARTKHPHHLGILKDLIVAYTRLSLLEKNSARGANLCLLIPQRLAEYEAGAGPLSAEEVRAFRRARALFYFHIGLYPLARAEIDLGGDDPDLAILKKAMEAIGQAEFIEIENFEVRGELATGQVTVFATKGNPSDPNLPFHKWFFITRLNNEAPPTNIWYTLSSQTLTKAPRFYLYGFAGNLQKLLKLYGRQSPAYDEVKATVRTLIGDALKKE
jgi:hypothetical protein